ncbi:amino acid permease/ SLC12A domain-containing protein [Aspergillus falconensis]
MDVAAPNPLGDGSSQNASKKQMHSTQHETDHGAETDLRRTLSTRHLTMIALGSSIGMGLWLGSGTSLRNGGPAALFIGYILAGTMIWSVAHAIGEMAVLYPLPSAFVQWSSIFISKELGFAVGWAYWFSAFITIANELQVGTLVYLALLHIANSTHTPVVSAGGAPNHGAVGFRYWNAEPFTNGFKGFLSVMPTCIFAMSGSENSALVAAETQNPRRSVPRAVGSIWLRLSLFYLLGALVVTITVSPEDPNLFGASGTNASPFVIAYTNAGIPVLAHMMNAVIFISVVSTGSISGFGGSRLLMGLSHLGLAPKPNTKKQIFGRADKQGRPVAGLVVTLLLGGGLAYLNVSASGADVFSWFSNLTSLFTLFGWGCICASHLRMRYAWKKQGRSEADLPWKTWTYPYASWWGLSWCILLIIAEFYLSVWPLHTKPNVTDFFANYVSIIVVLVVYIGARLWHRGPWWVDAASIDLDAPRRFYALDDGEGKKVNVFEKSVGWVFK